MDQLTLKSSHSNKPRYHRYIQIGRRYSTHITQDLNVRKRLAVNYEPWLTLAVAGRHTLAVSLSWDWFRGGRIGLRINCTTMAYAVGSHLRRRPAVTMGLWAGNRVSVRCRHAIFAQVIGAITAAAALLHRQWKAWV